MTKFLLPHVLHNTKYFLYTSFNRIYKYIRSNNRTNLILLFLNYIYNDIYLILQKLKLTFQKWIVYDKSPRHGLHFQCPR